MMQIKFILFGLLLSIPFLGNGQGLYYNQRTEFLKGNSHWAMTGDSAGLDFSSGRPVPMRTAMRSWEGTAAVSDPVTGKLLFYSNGEECWNANGNIMPNGDSLLGNSCYSLRTPNQPKGRGSTTQGVCIAPVLAEPGKYYLFSLVGKSNSRFDYSRGSLFYSVVDMNLNGGLGDIETGKKNIPLCRDTLSEMMITVPGDCGDIWLLVHRSPQEDFYAYHIEKGGIDTVPIISNVTTSLPAAYGPVFNILGYYQSYAAKSPDRKKLAISATAMFLICGFDPETGKVSNPVEVPSLGGNVSTEPCFSPDNSKLYIGTPDSVFQLNISVYDSLAINKSKKGIAINTVLDTARATYYNSQANMRLYGDSVYVWFTQDQSQFNKYISRINQPNLDGIACGFQQEAIPVLPGTTIMYGFGNEVVFPLAPDTFHSPTIDTAFCNGELLLTPSSLYEKAIWNDGSTQKSLAVNVSGLYWVVQNDDCSVYVDTFRVTLWEVPDPIINVKERRLSTSRKYVTYQWMMNGTIIQGATDSVYNVPHGGNGNYQVIVSDEHCADTSDIYVVNNAGEQTTIDMDNGVSDPVQIYPNPARDRIFIRSAVKVDVLVTSIEGKVVQKVDNATEFSVDQLADGVYFLHVFDQGNRLSSTKFTKVK